MRPEDFTSSNANLQVQNGSGQRVKAKDLGQEHVGLGLYREVWRDSTWDYICAVEPVGDGTVRIEYIQEEKPAAKQETPSKNVTVKTQDTQAVHKFSYANEDWELLVTKAPIARPEGRRVVTVQTTFEQPLADVQAEATPTVR